MWTLVIVLALLLFWAIGAYNRLVRLRSAALRAFAAVDAHLVQWLALATDQAPLPQPVPDNDDRPNAQPHDAAHSSRDHAALQAAAGQFAAALAVARARPLDAATVAALATGRDIVETAWEALVQAAARHSEGVAPPTMAAWLQQREQLGVHGALPLQQFNAAVAQYNAAVGQFPASVLAWLFGFHSARTL